MNPTPVRTSVIVIALLIVASLGAGLYWAKPQWNKYSQTNSMLKAEEVKNKELADRLGAIETFLAGYGKQDKSVETVNLALPLQNPKAADFVSSLGQLAQASGVVLSNLQMGDSGSGADKKPAAKNTIQPQKITFTATGSYPAFKDFVLRLENHLRLIDIQHIAVKQDESGQLDYQVDLTTYFQN